MLSDAKRSVFWSGVQQVSLFGLQLVTTLIIARLISPEDYGIIAMTIVFFAIAQVILDFGMEGALIQKKECSREDLDTAFIFSSAMSIVLYLVFYFTSGFIASYFDIPQLEKVIKISSAVLIVRALGIAPYAKMQRELRFKSLAGISACVTVFSGIIAIYLAYKGFAYWALVVQSLLNGFLLTVLYYVFSKWLPRFRFSANSFRKLIKFGLPMMFTSLINAVYANLYTLVIGKKFTEKHLGLYNRGAAFAGYVPTNLSDFTMRALYPIFSRYQDNLALLRQQAVRTLHLVSFVAVPICFFIVANCRDLVLVLLKDKWIEIVPIIQILCLANLSYVVTNLHLNILKSINRTDMVFVCEIIKKAAGIIALVITVPMGIMPMMWGILAYNILNVLIGILFVSPLVGMTLWDHIKSGIPTSAVAAVSVICAFFASRWAENIYARVSISGIIAIILFFGLSSLLKDKAIPFFLGYLRRR